MISDYEEVVIRFKAYRISYPLTQKELSDKSGVSLRMAYSKTVGLIKYVTQEVNKVINQNHRSRAKER